MLTWDQLEAYRERGYLVVPGLIEPERLGGFESRFCDLVEGRVPLPPRLHVVRDVMIAKGAVVPKTKLHAVNKIIAFEDDPVLSAYPMEPRLLDCVEALIGCGLMSIATNVINKPPDVDGRHPFHQDLFYFPLRPADSIVGAWTALGRSTRANGCLAVIPGSHRGPERKHADPDWDWVNTYFFAAEGVDLAERQHLEMEPGDTVLFHPLLLHGSGHNRTDGFRRAITAHFARADCERTGPPAVSAERFRPLR